MCIPLASTPLVTSSEARLASCCRRNPRSGNGPSRKYGMRVWSRMYQRNCSGRDAFVGPNERPEAIVGHDREHIDARVSTRLQLVDIHRIIPKMHCPPGALVAVPSAAEVDSLVNTTPSHCDSVQERCRRANETLSHFLAVSTPA
uniref:Putative transposable element n=1 Tax=Ixodes ricinus TaxID=34613 RepID=A0A0K8RA41_IXORI